MTRADVVVKAGDSFDELIAWLSILGIDWWLHRGWSVRRVKQEDMPDGRRSENHEQEPGEARFVAPEVAPGDNGGERVTRQDVERRVFQALAKQALARKTRTPRRSRSRRGTRRTRR